jgi:excisionase family DNA binding protein
VTPSNSTGLLTPREAAQALGVRTSTIAQWAREGRIVPIQTPGGHRRYPVQEIQRLLTDSGDAAEARRLTEDAVRLYEQGWSIRQVAARFDIGYGAMRRLLHKHTTVRKVSTGRLGGESTVSRLDVPQSDDGQ